MNKLQFTYLEHVKVRGVDKDGHKELFDDFVGEYLHTVNGKIIVSDGFSVWTVDPVQVSKI
jgi:hypothetical protein